MVLCLLEVGRLAHLWWNLEPPGLVKLERDIHKKDELSQRFVNALSISLVMYISKTNCVFFLFLILYNI